MPGLEDAPDGQYLTDRLAIEAVRFIEEHKASPFFLYLPHYAPHTPLIAKPEVLAKYPKWDGTRTVARKPLLCGDAREPRRRGRQGG